MASITAHPTLIALKKRSRARWLLEYTRLGLLVGASGSVLICLGGRLLGYGEWYTLAVVWLLVALAGSIVTALRRWPGDWAAARVADDLGLEERVTSALYAVEKGHPVSPLLAEEAQLGLARLVPSDYPLIPHTRRWIPVLLVSGALSIAALVPLPILGEGGRQAAESDAVAVTRKSVEELKSRLNNSPIAEPLAQKTEAELEALEKQLAEARSAVEAAKALEESQERLASLAQQEHYAWERALEGLVAAWGENTDLGALARALAERDVDATEETLAELSAMEENMAPEDRQRLQVALQAGANVARDVPSLASALRQAASQMGGDGERNDSSEGSEETLEGLASTLAEGVSRSQGLQTTRKALEELGRTRATLGEIQGGAASMAAAGNGTPGGNANSASKVSGSAIGGGGGAGSDVSGANAGGDGGGAGIVGESNNANNDDGGLGSGNGSGKSAGVGGAGSGSGAGAGADGEPSPGKPGASEAGSTMAGGLTAPNVRGATGYERIYAPTLMGGEGGATIRAPGEAAGASGDTVELPESQVSMGSLRPYNEVYGEYESAARESVSRKQLPPAMQTLVQRYFSSIKPEE